MRPSVRLAVAIALTPLGWGWAIYGLITVRPLLALVGLALTWTASAIGMRALDDMGRDRW